MKQKIFVEIGVCDFDTLEPLIDNGWKGYFVEPVSKFARKYNEHDVTECAISSYDGMIDFYVSRSDGEEWVKGVSHAVIQKGTKLLELENNTQEYYDHENNYFVL